MARVVFLGTPEFAISTFEALLDDSDIEVIGAITQPDRPAGRGQRLSAPPVKSLAVARGIPLFQPERLRGNQEAIRLLQKCDPDLMVVAAFGQILPRPFFDYPPFGTLNVHASLLPRYRGAAPVPYSILKGDTETGVTIMKIDQGLDTGAILAQSVVPIGERLTSGELQQILAIEGARLLVETVPLYLRGEAPSQPQDESLASYAPAIQKKQARIDWSQSSRVIHNQIRAFNPWPGAFAEFRGRRVKIWSSRSDPEVKSDSLASPAAPGEIIGWSKEEMVVQCAKESLLSIREVQLPDRKRTSALEFINGVGLKRGEVFV